MIKLYLYSSHTFSIVDFNLIETLNLAGNYASLWVDYDNDGDLDIVAGNLGLNYKYKASFETPFYMYLNDFDANNTDDIVLAYSQEDTVYPVRGRSCASGQMPFVKEKFKTSVNIK